MRGLVSIPFLIGLAALAGCSHQAQPEDFNFHYQAAQFQPAAAPDGAYVVLTAGAHGECQTPQNEMNLTLDQIAPIVQNGGPIYNEMHDCSFTYTLFGDNAAAVRNSGHDHFRLRKVGPNNDIQLHVEFLGGSGNPQLNFVFIETTNGLTVGRKTSDGDAEIHLSDGTVFTCSGGGLPWTSHGPDSTFFELTLDEWDNPPGFARGSFQCLARTRQPSDHRLLLILDGGFLMKVG